jgi:endonuclease/exonuclease/phosphatase family metal-dependent hydrolase
MRSLRVATWNVLHRVHGVNWSEAPIAAFPDERERIAEIARTVARWLAEGASVVCLQEVSGDQLAAVRSALGADDRVLSHCYPRVPRVRGAEPSPLVDASEHLVTVARVPSAVRADARTFDDPGKGLLAADVDGVALVNTHVSFGDRGAPQLARLAALAREARAGAIVLGDFNAPADVVRAALGGPVLADVSGQGPTRIATAEHPGKVIDHVAVFRGRPERASILDVGGLSDHRPVVVDVVFP